MNKIVSLILLVISSIGSAETLFQYDYDIVGFGAVDEIIFSSDFTLGHLDEIENISFELSHSYVAELILTLTAPDGSIYILMNGDGLRTRVGSGTGLLEDVEEYVLKAPNAELTSVNTWDFTGYQSGGIYGAREWPFGNWESGKWNLTIYNDNKSSSSSDGVIGRVKIEGIADGTRPIIAIDKIQGYSAVSYYGTLQYSLDLSEWRNVEAPETPPFRPIGDSTIFYRCVERN